MWLCSVTLITTFFFLFSQSGILSLVASLVGTTALIFCAKGNPIGQGMMIIFSIIYGIISYSFEYYGEMVTYLGMSAPMAVYALVSWLRNPYKGKKSEVTVNEVNKREIVIILILTVIVTELFYFILKEFGTANLLPSTVSVTTSFAAVCFSARRSPYFALAYAINDIVLIILWTLAAIEDISYVSVIVCFVMFLVNDTYSFINWTRMKKKQNA
jgi:nicotinamide mononucleotide transporter PnuC